MKGKMQKINKWRNKIKNYNYQERIHKLIKCPIKIIKFVISEVKNYMNQ